MGIGKASIDVGMNRRSAGLTATALPFTGSHFAAGMQRLLVVMLFSALLFALFGLSQAHAQNRTLSLYNTHTHERLTVTYKRNGRFVQAGLNQLNRFLRDWRRDEVTRIDPELFDIVWTVYREVGASEPIHVVSAYRSPATNNMLRQRSGGVARNSQHTQGRAMDFFIPGVQASAIRAAGLRLQQGGVGYYPRSNTPFVHLDTGTVRMWPRMTRSQLSRVFPNGRTIHVPADGRPMPGFEQAQRELQRGSRSSRSASDTQTGGNGGGLLAALFGGGNEPEPPAQVATAPAAAAPAAVQVASVAPQQQLEVANAPRERYAAPSPVLPPNVSAASTSPGGTFAAPSTIAGLQVPSPTPAPTLDELQLAALGTNLQPVAQPGLQAAAQPAAQPLAPGASALESAFATAALAPQTVAPAVLSTAQPVAAPSTPLPPISREEQIAQSVPAPGQIAAIIEARFAEQRAAQASLVGQVNQAIEVATAPTAAAAPSPRFTAPVPAPVPAPAPLAPPALQTTLAAAPAEAPATTQIAAQVAAQATPAPLALQDAPNQPGQSLIAAAFAAQEQARTPAQSAIDALTGASTATQSGITGQLYPLSSDLSAALAKHSIRGSQHAALVRPTGTVTLSPTVARSSGFQPTSSFQLRTDGFGAPSGLRPGS